MESVDRDAGKIEYTVKGRPGSEKKRKDLTKGVQAAVEDWLTYRGTEPGPLLTNFDRAGKGEGLDGGSVNRIIKRIAKKAEVGHATAHGIRHTSITDALQDANGDVVAVMDHSDHADPRTLLKYNDNRNKQGSRIAARLSAKLD